LSRRPAIVALTMRHVIARLYVHVRRGLRAAYKTSYCRIHYNAHVNSGDVSVPLKLGAQAWIDDDVTVFPGVEIGGYTAVNRGTLIESGVIGRFCSIAANVSIGMAEHPLHNFSTHVATYEAPLFGLISQPKEVAQRKPPPVIGNDVWIARGATVLRGVTIGDGAVVAAGAMVTRDVPPYAIVAGNPARVVSHRFDEEVIDQFLARKWWDDEEFYTSAVAARRMGIDGLF
jgi:virginiamycin A acetyltransferase